MDSAKNFMDEFNKLCNEDVTKKPWTKKVDHKEKNGVKVVIYQRPAEGGGPDLMRNDLIFRGVSLKALDKYIFEQEMIKTPQVKELRKLDV